MRGMGTDGGDGGDGDVAEWCLSVVPGVRYEKPVAAP